MYMNKMPVFRPCRKCSKLGVGPAPGYYYTKVDGFDVVVECNCHKSWRERKDNFYAFSRAGVLGTTTEEDYLGTQSRRDLECLMKVKDNPEKFKDKCIYLWGPNGTQKTSMCMYLGRELIKKGYSVKYTLFNKLVSDLQPTFNTANDEEELRRSQNISDCRNVDFLILDEVFDRAKNTLFKSGYQIPFIDEFLRTRVDIDNKGIIFISNVKSCDIEKEGYSKSLQDFVERHTSRSTLEFKDRYSKEISTVDPRSLFED